MLTFREFVDEIRERIPDYLMQYDIEKIDINRVLKDNGAAYTGMTIRLEGENVAPNIYLDDYYIDYTNGGNDMEETLRAVADAYAAARQDDVMSYVPEDGNVKNAVFMKLVNYDMNRELLATCPYVPYMDMAVTFRYLVRKDETGIASAHITYKNMERLGLQEGELFDLAKENTCRLFPTVFEPLGNILRNMMPGMELPEDELIPLYVLTNDTGINGASAMVYEDELIREFAVRAGQDIYILPSSLHEVLLLPADKNMSDEEIQAMVREINRNVLSDSEFLSDNIYKYDVREQKLEQVTGAAERARERYNDEDELER